MTKVKNVELFSLLNRLNAMKEIKGYDFSKEVYSIASQISEKANDYLKSIEEIKKNEKSESFLKEVYKLQEKHAEKDKDGNIKPVKNGKGFTINIVDQKAYNKEIEKLKKENKEGFEETQNIEKAIKELKEKEVEIEHKPLSSIIENLKQEEKDKITPVIYESLVIFM